MIENSILDAVLLALTSVSGIEEVLDFQMIPLDRDTTKFPVTAYYFEEDGWSDRNRAEVVTGLLHIETVWISHEARRLSRKEVISLKGGIHHVIFLDTMLNSLCQKIEKIPAELRIANDDELHLVQQYRLSYLHRRGDPTSQNIQP